jgi:oxygen-dependent protoporphyrinogen oxidase
MATDRLGSPHVVVIGGGMAGVCAARYLDDNGARVTVLEARPELDSSTSSGWPPTWSVLPVVGH